MTSVSTPAFPFTREQVDQAANLAAEFLGRDLGRLVNVLGLVLSVAIWTVAKTALVLVAVLRFAAKTYIYATATKGQRRTIKARWHRSHTTRRRVNAKTYRPATASKGARK